MRNKYIFRSHISEKSFRRLIRLFVIDMETTKMTVMAGLNRNTVNRILRMLRIAKLCEQESFRRAGLFELDECYLGARRVRGKRGRGAKGTTILFGIYERTRKYVYVRIVRNVKSHTLMKILKDKVEYESTIYTDGFPVNDALLKDEFAKHLRVEHARNEFVRGHVHFNGIESF